MLFLQHYPIRAEDENDRLRAIWIGSMTTNGSTPAAIRDSCGSLWQSHQPGSYHHRQKSASEM